MKLSLIWAELSYRSAILIGNKNGNNCKDSIIKRFELSDIAIPNTIEVVVDGVVSTDWTYDAPNNTVVFNGGHIPAIGSSIEITYNSRRLLIWMRKSINPGV